MVVAVTLGGDEPGGYKGTASLPGLLDCPRLILDHPTVCVANLRLPSLWSPNFT